MADTPAGIVAVAADIAYIVDIAETAEQQVAPAPVVDTVARIADAAHTAAAWCDTVPLNAA